MLRSPVAAALSVAILTCLGSVVEAAVTQKTVMHPAFKDAGRKDGLQIWRIESFEPKPVPPNEYGKFYEGDSYIVLSTKEDKSKKGTFSWDIYFWLGSKTSQDESGAAAILSVELDDGLGGSPVQHRETQGHESSQFLSFFKPAIRYLPGGVASGFHHVDTNAPGEKRLYQIKGKKNIRVRIVEPNVKSMNKGDCFILDTGSDLYVFAGSSAKGTERLKAISVANQIRDQDHNGRAKVNIIDSNSTPNDVDAFFKLLGSGSLSQVANAPATDDDQDFEKNQDAVVALYKVSDAGGNLVAEKIGQKPLKQGMLKPEDCFILDTATSGIYVWIGKDSTTQEKVEALKKGQAFLASNKYPAWTKMRRIVQNSEPTAFKEYFSDWRDSQLTGGLGRGSGSTRRARSVPSRRCGPASGFRPDDGAGRMEVYRLIDSDLIPVDEQHYGMFFGGDCYVIVYVYDAGRGPQRIVYNWQGKDSSAEEKFRSALSANRESENFEGNSIVIKVDQGKEPYHFNSLFKGRLIIMDGGKGQEYGSIEDYRPDGNRLFQILGSCDNDIRAVQVPLITRSLNSNDAFFLETPERSYIWLGKHCNRLEQSMAKLIRQRLCADRDVVNMSEGEEPTEFWDALGGSGEYDTDEDNDEDGPGFEPRLFHCYNDDQDKFFIEEVSDFDQKDLYPDDVMVLDSGEEIYVWIGREASVEEKLNAYKMAQSYIRKSDRFDDERRVVVRIKQGEEPESFTSLFPNWDDGYMKNISVSELENEVYK